MNKTCCAFDPRTAAVALLRWSLGILLLFFGIGKFPDVAGFAQNYLVPQFKNTWLPAPIVLAFAYALPFLEVLLGGLLICGIWRNPVLLLAGLLFLSLTFGQILLKQPNVVSINALYVLMTAITLFLGEYDCWTLAGTKEPQQRTSTG